MKQLKEHIKSRIFKPVYLFTGEEKYLLDVYLKRMIDIIYDGQDKTMNMDRFNQDNKDFEKILGSLETLPFFADKRVVVLDNLDLFNSKNKSKAEAFIKKMEAVKDTTICFVIEETIDKRIGLFKYINTNGFFCEFSFLDEQELIQFIGRELQRHNIKISTQVAKYFLATVGFELNIINKEISKLIDYLGNEEIVTIEAIDDVCIKHIEAKIFELVDAIGSRQREKAMLLYQDMIAVKEPETRILFMISRQISLIFQVKLLQEKRVNISTIAKKIKVPEFVAKKLVMQSQKFSLNNLNEHIKSLVELEFGFKSGKIELGTGMELFILQMCRSEHVR